MDPIEALVNRLKKDFVQCVVEADGATSWSSDPEYGVRRNSE